VDFSKELDFDKFNKNKAILQIEPINKESCHRKPEKNWNSTIFNCIEKTTIVIIII
jgi:hypothetical protein